MQVNKCQSPNFGMALKIDKGAKNALKNLSQKELYSIQKAGEDLKNTKFYDVRIDKNLKCFLEADPKAYFGKFKGDKYYTRITGGDTCANLIMIGKDNIHGLFNPLYIVTKYLNEMTQKANFDVIKTGNDFLWQDKSLNKISDVSQLADVAKILDNEAVKKSASIAKKNAEKVKENAITVEKLIKDFGE